MNGIYLAKRKTFIHKEQLHTLFGKIKGFYKLDFKKYKNMA